MLLLQGPMGPFFARLARYLERNGAQVHKVNFNGGDWLFYRGRGAVAYRGMQSEWGEWLGALLCRHAIDAVVLFGQSRMQHAVARTVAKQLGIEVYVFEEGYVRPDFVTLECGGVNGDSSLSKDPAFYAELPEPAAVVAKPTAQRFALMAWYAACYCVAMSLLRPVFPHHRYHRSLDPLAEALRWLRGGWRKLMYRFTERGAIGELIAEGRSKRWFLLPLQVHNDSQIIHHSPYADVEAVIEHVVASFAAHAPTDTWLVVKHHPMDRAYRCYRRQIRECAQRHGVLGRVRYVHDLHLPTLLKHARGVVTVNSTTGLQALFHHTPVVALGQCIYALRGLATALPLERFWAEPAKVDEALSNRFRHHVVRQTQLNASFYARAPAFDVPISPDWHFVRQPPRSAWIGEDRACATRRSDSAVGWGDSLSGLGALVAVPPEGASHERRPAELVSGSGT